MASVKKGKSAKSRLKKDSEKKQITIDDQNKENEIISDNVSKKIEEKTGWWS